MNAYAIYGAESGSASSRSWSSSASIIAFVITHATPIDPVEQSIAAATPFGSTSPEAIEMMRASLRELYGLGGSLWSHISAFWRRVVVGDFGPRCRPFRRRSRP